MPNEKFRMVCYAEPAGGFVSLDGAPPLIRIHVLDVDEDVSYVGIIAPTLACGLAKLKALTEFISEFLEAAPEEKLELAPNTGICVWPRRK